MTQPREAGAGDGTSGWHRRVLDALVARLAERSWCCELLLRGSLARAREDADSDIDLVATVATLRFEEALHELAGAFPLAMPGLRRPWLDTLVADFGGVGFVYLKEIAAGKWGQIDIYLLPQSCRARLLQHPNETTPRLLRSLRNAPAADGAGATRIDAARSRFQETAKGDIEQAALACYVQLFLLRKRLVRRDLLQIFADTYAAAERLRDLVYRALAPGREGIKWRDAGDVAAACSAPDLVMEAFARFAGRQPIVPSDLADRIRGLESLLPWLAPAMWEAEGDALRSLGRYLAGDPEAAS